MYNDLKYYEDILRASREVLEAVNTAAKRVCNEFEHVILMTQFNVVENHYNVYSIAIRDQVMNALGTVPCHNDIINLNELRLIVRGLKIKRLLVMMEFHLRSISLHLSDC